MIFWFSSESLLSEPRPHHIRTVCVWPPLQRVFLSSRKKKLIICRSGRNESTQCMCMYGAFGVLGSDDRHGCDWSICAAWQNQNQLLLSVLGTETHSDTFVTQKKLGRNSVCNSPFRILVNVNLLQSQCTKELQYPKQSDKRFTG